MKTSKISFMWLLFLAFPMSTFPMKYASLANRLRGSFACCRNTIKQLRNDKSLRSELSKGVASQIRLGFIACGAVDLYMEYRSDKYGLEGPSCLSAERSREIKVKLQKFYDEGLLKVHPSKIHLCSGRWSTKQTLFHDKHMLRVKDKKDDSDYSGEFYLGHEVLGHINNNDSWRGHLPMLAWQFITSGATVRSVVLRKALTYPVAKGAKNLMVRFGEEEADIASAQNCSLPALEHMIKEYKEYEAKELKAIKEYSRQSDPEFVKRRKEQDSAYEVNAAKMSLALLDEHIPFTKGRSDRLQAIYDKRVAALPSANAEA